MRSELFSAFDFYPSTKKQTSSSSGFGSSLQSIFIVACFFVGFVYFPLFTGKTLLFGDNYSLMVPGKLFTTNWIKEGIFPMWNPTIFAGIPWIGDINQSVLYPTTLFFVVFAPAVALNLTILTHLVFTFVGMTFLARHLRNPLWASYLAAILWTFCPQITGSINNISTIQSMSWMPWVVLFGLNLFSLQKTKTIELTQKVTKKSDIAFVLFCLAVLAQFLGGYPQHVIYSILTAVVLSFGELFATQPTPSIRVFTRWLTTWAIAALIVVPLTAVAWLPFIPVLQESTRTIQSAEQAAAGSLQVSELIKFFVPTIFEHPVSGMKWGPSWSKPPTLMLFISWIGISVIGIGILQKKTKIRDIFFGLLILFSLIIAMGDSLPTFELIQKIPLIKSSRGMSTILMIPALLLPLLIAHFAHKIELQRKKFSYFLSAIAVISGIFFLGLLLVWTTYDQVWHIADRLLSNKLSQSLFHTVAIDYVITEIILLTLLVLSFSLYLSLLFLRQKRYHLVLAVVAIEMAFAVQGHLFFAPTAVYDLQSKQFEEITQNTKESSGLELSQYRILTRNYNSPYTDFGSYWDALSVRTPFSDSYVDKTELQELNHLKRMRDGITPNWNMVANIPIIHGYTTLLPKNMHTDFANGGILDEENYFTQNNISVGRVDGETSINNLPQIQLSNPELAKWSVKYYLVDTWFPDYDEAMPEVVLAETDSLKLYELPNTLPRIRTKSGEEVIITNFYENPNKLSFTVEVPDDSGLVIADRYDRDWKATNGVGEAVQLYEDAGLRILDLKAGTHTVTIQYYPTFFYLGMGVTFCSFGVLLFFYLHPKKTD